MVKSLVFPNWRVPGLNYDFATYSATYCQYLGMQITSYTLVSSYVKQQLVITTSFDDCNMEQYHEHINY